MRDGDKEWDFYLRSLSNIARDSNLASDPASDPSLLNSVRKLYQLCKEENSEDLVARVYPHLSKIFQRTVASLSQSTSSCGLLLLAIIQFFLDFGEIVLHDADPSLRTFFRSCLSREFADITIAEATLEFLNVNKRKLLASYPALLPQFFPLLLKLIAWNGERLQKSFLKVFPELISPASFLPLFPSLVDLPILVVALERVERSSGSRIGSSIATIQKSTAPEERHRTSPGMAAALQALVNAPQSDRLKQSLKISPRLLDVYCAVAIRDVNDSLNCALIPLLMARNDALFPDKYYCYQVRKKLLEYMLASFQRSPNFVALLKKPIMNRLGEAYDSPAKTELALQLCWAIGEHGGGGASHKDAARELFENLELLLYENLSSSRLGLRESAVGSDSENLRKSSQSRLLCFVITAIAKLATYHRELLPRARVSLGKAC
ncbi:AP-5 complex subunit zeta-1 [Linum perenne]